MKSNRKNAKQGNKGILTPPSGLIGNVRWFENGLVRINELKNYTIRK